jgi:hypothetical protein
MKLFRNTIFLLILLLNLTYLFSQSRIVINNDPWLVMNNNVFIVIDNNNGNAITLAGSGGRIVSEAENNRIRWMVGTATGTYTLPFADNVGEGGAKIPLTFSIGTSGIGAGYIDFSTFDGATWDNSLYMPSMVTHMGQYLSPNAPNNSQRAIDRFWIMNPLGYGTKPTPSQIIFTYIDNEHTALGNFITESALGAQRFNNGTQQWGDMLPIGLVNIGANTVTTPGVTTANYFAAWTLSDSNDPLPIALLSFSASCENASNVLLNWTTASEQNNSFFTVYKSLNGKEFSVIGNVPAAGNGSSVKQYSFIDNSIERTAYYKLSQTDFDGNTTFFDAIIISCKEENAFEIVSVYSNSGILQTMLKVPSDGNYKLIMFDVKGRVVYQHNEYFVKGINKIPLYISTLSQGLYFLQMQSETEAISKKVIIGMH